MKIIIIVLVFFGMCISVYAEDLSKSKLAEENNQLQQQVNDMQELINHDRQMIDDSSAVMQKQNYIINGLSVILALLAFMIVIVAIALPVWQHIFNKNMLRRMRAEVRDNIERLSQEERHKKIEEALNILTHNDPHNSKM